MSGKILAGRYEILEKLGEGGYAHVWKAKQLQPEGFVAVKILLEEHAGDPQLVEEFLQEAGLYVEFRDDPHVVTILECGTDPETNTHYLVMTLLDGTVEDEVKAGGALDPDKVFRIAEHVGRALDSVHRKNLVHRDVKLSNIMHLASSDRYVLTDFGIGMVQETAEKTANTQDMSSAVGTWSYASPEQIQAKNKKDIGPRSDFYSLGIALYRAATGEYPFPPNFPQVMIDHVNTPAPDPREKTPAIPAGLAQIILRCLEKNPDDRYASAGEFLEAVKHARAGGVLDAEEDGAAVGGAGGLMSLRNLLVGGIAILIILAAAGFGLFGGGKSQKITIDSIPTGATYKLYQGEKMRFSEPMREGIVPAQIEGLEPGAYSLDLALEGYFPVDGHVIAVEPGEQELPPIALDKAQSLGVTATPAGAHASLTWLEGDGASYAARPTPATFEPLHLGQHRLEVMHDGFVPYMDTVVIGDRNQTVSVKLEPTHRVTLWLFSDPAGAKVAINGALVSQPTNCEVREIPSGPQTFRLTLEGYAP
ncbi:MAG: protein kinase, partial [Gemmatimonadetes bacterium]|nr:protein kinase [Gemmatimonadota bacterium]